MAKSPNDRRLRLVIGLAMALILAAPAGAAVISGSIPAGPGKPPVKYECDHAEVEYKANVMHLRGNVKIWQGDISVAAETADAKGTTQDFKDSHWVFNGKVHVRSESQGDLRAEHATVEIAGGQLASAVVTGSPALFEQTRPTAGRLAKGHARSIDYEVAAATVTLTGDAVLSDDHNSEDMHSPSITYNIHTMGVEADGGVGDDRAHYKFTPHSGPGKKP
ncbi:MAG TPA: LptA/OstA family protein [Steroidobacteraceae bacterium]|nr:LptA/OstA family protein [Steroidobacteraceae bacterium]